MQQMNYGVCDRADCTMCAEIKAANPGVDFTLEPAKPIDMNDVNAAILAKFRAEDLEHKMQIAALEEAAHRADGDFNLNKSLGVRIDAAVSGLVHGVSVVAIARSPKAADPDGTVYIVDPDPVKTNSFNGHANEVASKANGAWTFQAPHANETHLVETDNMMWTWSTSTTPPSWVKVGSTGNAEKVNEAIHKAADKATPVDNDELALTDSADTASPFSLKKLTWANLKKGVFDSWGDSFKRLVDTGQETNSPDIRGFLPTIDHTGATWGITWENFKAWIFKDGEVPVPESNMHDDSTFQVRGADGHMWKVSWAWIKNSIHDWIAGVGKATSLSDTDLIPFISGDATDRHLYRVPVSVIKTAVAPVGAPITLWVDDEDVSTNGGEATFTIPAGTNARHIEWDGWAAPQGGDSAYPLLVLTKTSSNTDVATQAILSSYSTLTHYRSANPGQESTFTGTDGIRLTQTSSNTTHVKGNQNSYFNIKLYRNSNWVQIHWNCFYKSNNDTTILVDGYASGNMGDGEISKFGLYFKDSTNGGTRPVLADAKCIIHR